MICDLNSTCEKLIVADIVSKCREKRWASFVTRRGPSLRHSSRSIGGDRRLLLSLWRHACEIHAGDRNGLESHENQEQEWPFEKLFKFCSPSIVGSFYPALGQFEISVLFSF